MRWLLHLVLFTIIASCAPHIDASAPVVKTNGINGVKNLKDVAEVQYTKQTLLLSDVLEISSWDKQFSLNPMPTNEVMWLRFSLQHEALTNQAFTLISGNTFVDRIDGFLLDEQGRIVQSIQRNQLDNETSSDAQNAFKLDFTIRPDQTLSIYLRVHDDGPASFPIELWEASAYEKQNATRFILLGALSGGLSLLATYFFITYLVRSTPSRFWFSIFSVSSMTTLLSAEGILPNVFALSAFAAEITAFALMVTLFAAIKIGRVIFSPVSKNWLRAHYALLIAPFASLFLSNDFWQLVALLSIITVFLLSKLIATLVYRAQVDLRSTTLYFSGWFALGIVSALEISGFIAGASHLSGSSVLPFSFTCIGTMLIGVAIVSREQSIQRRTSIAKNTKIRHLSDFKNYFQSASDGLYVAKPNGEFTIVNPNLAYLFGFIDSQHMLSTFTRLSDLFADSADADLLFGELQIQQEVVGREVKGKRLDGSEFWFSISCNITKQHETNIQYGSVFDVTERRLHQLNLQYLNTHDQLTGLYNRKHFVDFVADTIDRDLEGKSLAMLYIDVDQFKVINDTCGHTAGDIYIKELSHELFEVIHQHLCFARLSADEFGLLTTYENNGELDTLAHSVLNKVRNFEFKWDKHTFNQSVSIGICVYEDNAMSPEEFLSYADTACVVAKENGRNNFHIYSNDMGMNVTYERELYWINQVTRALKEDTFVLFYQHYRPLSSTEEKDHFEVLVRLLDPTKKTILPDYFMPAAERYNLSCKIDRWVVENTFAWLNTHEEFQHSTATCNINLSGASISDEDFKFFLLNAFEKYHIPHDLICFEITETMAIIKMTEAIKFMDEFKRLGCTFALDDFGTGFSSYGYLKNLPVDYVKIDGNFIRDILTDPIDLAMVTSIRDIAEAMSIKTVAEFVENKDVMVQLGKMGVDYAQGYAVAEPDRLDNFTPYSQWIQ